MALLLLSQHYQSHQKQHQHEPYKYALTRQLYRQNGFDEFLSNNINNNNHADSNNELYLKTPKKLNKIPNLNNASFELGCLDYKKALLSSTSPRTKSLKLNPNGNLISSNTKSSDLDVEKSRHNCNSNITNGLNLNQNYMNINSTTTTTTNTSNDLNLNESNSSDKSNQFNSSESLMANRSSDAIQNKSYTNSKEYLQRKSAFQSLKPANLVINSIKQSYANQPSINNSNSNQSTISSSISSLITSSSTSGFASGANSVTNSISISSSKSNDILGNSMRHNSDEKRIMESWNLNLKANDDKKRLDKMIGYNVSPVNKKSGSVSSAWLSNDLKHAKSEAKNELNKPAHARHRISSYQPSNASYYINSTRTAQTPAFIATNKSSSSRLNKSDLSSNKNYSNYNANQYLNYVEARPQENRIG